MSSEATNLNDTDPLERYRGLTFTLRADLKFSRQIYQGEPVYVVQDPVTFRTHRLTVFQYSVLSSLDHSATFGENFEWLVEDGQFLSSEEQLYVDLLSSFAGLGLIVMAAHSGEQLFEKHQELRSRRNRSRLLGLLFIQIPLVRPDRFLTRTIRRLEWLFTPAFGVAWLFGMLAAVCVILSRLEEATQPLNGLLANSNLAFLWGSFVLLKVWHELGHGYACKRFGGYVPQMGMILIAGTPAAFVDASAAWNFPQRRRRLLVMLGGMYFESLIFIPAVFVWAFAASPMVKSCAYQLALMASVVTFFFNANPLMKFDGYFILSELVGIQNLRQQASEQIRHALASVFVGVKPPPSGHSRRTQVLIVLYGVSASIYKFFLVIGISRLIAVKFPLVGLGLAAFYILSNVGGAVWRAGRFLLVDRRTQEVRWRARFVAVALLVGCPAAICTVPVPFGVVTQGQVAAEREAFVNTLTAGAFETSLIPTGSRVTYGSPLVQMSNTGLTESLHVALAQLRDAETQWEALLQGDPAGADIQRHQIVEYRKKVDELTTQLRQLQIDAPEEGVVVRLPLSTERGRWYQEGAAVAIVVDGRPVLRTWLNEEQLGSIVTETGSPVQCRIAGRSDETWYGEILSIEPAAEQLLRQFAVTHVTGGEIVVDPVSGQPMEPVFQVDVVVSSGSFDLTEHGARVTLNLPRRNESIGAWTVRRCLRFVHSLLAA